jgi:hypothetical protein
VGEKETDPFRVTFNRFLKLALRESGRQTRTVTVVVLLSVGALHGQTPRPALAAAAGTSSIRGRVLAAETNTPLRNARIDLEDGARRVVSTVLADGEGRFALTAVASGVYTLIGAKPGYVKTSFVAPGNANAGRTNRTPIRVAEGATVENLDIRLSKSGAIMGRIVDGLGDAATIGGVRLRGP